MKLIWTPRKTPHGKHDMDHKYVRSIRISLDKHERRYSLIQTNDKLDKWKWTYTGLY